MSWSSLRCATLASTLQAMALRDRVLAQEQSTHGERLLSLRTEQAVFRRNLVFKFACYTSRAPRGISFLLADVGPQG